MEVESEEVDETTFEFELPYIFTEKPKTHWEAILPQCVCLALRRYCVARLLQDMSGTRISDVMDLSGGVPDELWESQFDLVRHCAPDIMKPYVEEWFQPETAGQVDGLYDLDEYARDLVAELDRCSLSGDEAAQDAISDILDRKFYEFFKEWLGPEKKDLLFFPSTEESDEANMAEKIARVMKVIHTPPPRRRFTRRARDGVIEGPIHTLFKQKKTRRN
uniref:Uncharacterized protein n=1 Tax=viral metagenome TaxID=1070528 RepID=A0A6C0BJM3_9ZZZZ